jgi:dipeptidyl aminopeptidase/acylaminoacyl peptidase
MVYDRGTKAIKDLLPKFDNWVDEEAWGPDSSGLIFSSGEKGESPILETDLQGRVYRVPLQGSFSDLHVVVESQTGTEANTTARWQVIASSMTVQEPGEVVKFFYSRPEQQMPDVGSGSGVSHLTHLNTTLLAQLDLGRLESFWFPSVGNVKVEGFLIRPPGFDASKKYPVKFLIHGGPEGEWGDMWSYRWNPELFAANGYIVVMINPGGSVGYGQAFVDRVNGDWGGRPFIDLMRGLDYAEQHYPFIDKTRECALGASYGGYMANWILGHTDRFKCIVTHDGMFNTESAYGTTDELWFNEWEFRGTPWSNPATYHRWSPMLAETHFKTPTLVIHGQLDYRLDVSEGYQLFDTLQRMKVPSKMLYFPDEGHWVLKPQNSQLWYQTVNDWVDHWTGQGTGNR